MRYPTGATAGIELVGWGIVLPSVGHTDDDGDYNDDDAWDDDYEFRDTSQLFSASLKATSSGFQVDFEGSLCGIGLRGGSEKHETFLAVVYRRQERGNLELREIELSIFEDENSFENNVEDSDAVFFPYSPINHFSTLSSDIGLSLTTFTNLAGEQSKTWEASVSTIPDHGQFAQEGIN